jgi:dTDP-glucose 4,6-dehydratase
MTQKDSKLIVVTGGWGFIGSRFVKAVLENTSYNVKVIDKLTYAGKRVRVYNHIDPKYQMRLQELRKDISDVSFADVAQAEYIVNFAAESHVDNSIKDGKPFIKSNIEGVFNLLERAKKIEGLKKFVQVSTDEVYGDMYDLRGRQYADETFKLRPSSYYSASKASADLLVESAARTFGVPYIITRSCNNFGPNQDPEKFIPKIFKSISKGDEVPIYGDGLQSREWIHVDDNAQIILELTLSGAEDEVYNIGSGFHYKNIEIVNYIGGILGKEVLRTKVKDRLGHDRVYRLDSKKVEGFLGERVYQTLEGYLKDVVNESARV